MAARNKDSKSIFDLYVNRYLNEQADDEGEETNSPSKKNEPASAGNTTPVSTSGIDLTTGINQTPDSQYTGSGLSLQPQGSTDYVGNARSANETQDKANSLGIQNYNQSGGFEPQQVDIGTGTVGQGQMPPPSPSTSTSGTTTPAAPQPPSKEDIQRYGRTGAELRQSSGNQFMTRSDRMDQAKVDKILGAGKYKAGTAEANLALANYFKQNPVTVTPGSPAGGPAGSIVPPAPENKIYTADSRPSGVPGVTLPNWVNRGASNQQPFQLGNTGQGLTQEGPTQVKALIDQFKSLPADQQAEFKKSLG